MVDHNPIHAHTHPAGSMGANRPSLRTGQTMVEFALALPLLLTVLVGVIEVSRWMQSYMAVQYAAQEATRYAATGAPPMMIADGADSCQELGHPVTAAAYSLPSQYDQCRVDWIKHIAREMAKTGLAVNDAETNVTKPYYLGVMLRGAPTFGAEPVSDHPGAARTKIEVTVIYNHPISNPFLMGLLPTIRVIGVSQMVNEPWAGGAPEVPPMLPTATTLPLLDTDGDFWPDVDERDIYGTSPSNPDTDGDGYFEGDGTLVPTEPSVGAALDPCDPNPASIPCLET